MAGVPAGAADNEALVERVLALQIQLNATADAAQVAGVAEEVGHLIDLARKEGMQVEKFEALRGLLAAMQARSRRLLADAEHKTGQDEAALERLYRSQAWDDLGFAEASFIYWAAWTELKMAQHARFGKDKILARARRGFQTASLQLFRPGLFYGGWLGIGCVAVEQGQLTHARQIFAKLEEALSASPDTPISKAITLEIRLQEARMGTYGADDKGRNITAEQADVLRGEIFALLEQGRNEGAIREGVSYRLRALLEADHVDQSLIDTMMVYAQQVATLDAGPWSMLAAAEFRLRHQDYHNAAQEYEAFFKEVKPQRGINLDGFRYHWALAAYQAGSYQAALRILARLARRDGLTTELDQAVTKLIYTVHVARAQRGMIKIEDTNLRHAAQQFVQKNPDDPNADQARLYLAQSLEDTGASLQMLGRIRTATAFNGEVERATFHFIAREFHARVASGEMAQAVEIARRGADTYGTLTDADSNNLLNLSTLLQMRALIETNPDALIASLDFLDDLRNYEPEEQDALLAAHPDEVIRSLGLFTIKQEVDSVIEQARLWSRLQLYERAGDWSRLTKLLRSLADDNFSKLPLELLYPWITQRQNVAQRLELALIVQSAAAVLPDLNRRFYRIIIESLRSGADYQAAYQQALAFTRKHPNSGDAWRLLAQTAELTGDHFAADKAWSVITDKTTPMMEAWWEAMLNRGRIRSNSTRPEQACPLLEVLENRRHHLPESQKPAFTTLLANNSCRQINPSAQALHH